MLTEDMENLIPAMIADNPKQTADSVLGYLMACFHARAGAILSADEGGLLLIAHRELHLPHLALLPQFWARHRSELVAAKPVLDRSYFLVPLLDHSELVGIVYLQAPKHSNLSALTVFGPTLVRALRAHTNPAAYSEYLVSPARVEDMQREQLLAVLIRHEWNIAAVARYFGVTRRTIYLRLARWEIPRERILKTRRKECPL